jgi:hypothetical protein
MTVFNTGLISGKLSQNGQFEHLKATLNKVNSVKILNGKNKY